MKHLQAKQLAVCALFAALTAVCSQIQIPLPAIPINLALFAVHLCAALLAPRYAALSMAAYILLGAVGVPVFAGLKGGIAVLFDKTGGYIIGYLLSALLTSWLIHRKESNFLRSCLAMVAGVAVCYVFGTVWFMVLTGTPLWTSLTWCVLPFLPGDAVKILLAAFLAKRLQVPMRRMLA